MDPSLPLARLAVPRVEGSGTVPWLEARLRNKTLALCANARAGIRQAVDRLGLAPGDEVLVPAWNCGSEVDPLLDAGLTVRLYPVDTQGRASTEALSACLSETTRAIYLIHYFGWPQPEAAEIARLCRTHGLHLIEDCALCLLSDSPDGPPGQFGDAAVFCFYKFFPLIGGGALALRKDLEPPLFDRPLPKRFQEKALARDMSRRLLGQGTVTAIRTRLRRAAGHTTSETKPEASGSLPDMPAHYYFDPGFRNATISGLTRRLLARTDPAAAQIARRHNYRCLLAAFAGADGIEPIFPDLPEGVSPLSFPILVAPSLREQVGAALPKLGIAATPWWSGYHRGLDWSGAALAPARALKDRAIALPLHPGLGEAELRWMAKSVIETVAQAADMAETVEPASEQGLLNSLFSPRNSRS